MIAITGATGFLGSELVNSLLRDNHTVKLIVRKSGRINHHPNIIELEIPDLKDKFNIKKDLQDVDTLIHVAGRAHVMNEKSSNPLDEFRSVNVESTLALAQQAANSNVRRFIFISSIKVNGEKTYPNKPFTADCEPDPKDEYGLSKLEAELALLNLSKNSKLEVVIIRPPLIYGKGVKGNIAKIMKLINLGIPLPFGSINNKRSMIGLDNMIDLIKTCIHHPNAANEIFLASDDHDLSTSEFVDSFDGVMNFKVPAFIVKLVLSILGKKDIAQRLLSSLQIDISKTKNLLGWEPPMSVKLGFERLNKKS